VTLGWVVLAGAVACALGLVGPRLKPIFIRFKLRMERSRISAAKGQRAQEPGWR
jgi:hypothetical protein